MTDTQAARRRLEAELAELEDRLQRIEQDLAEPADPDSSERAVQMEDDQSLEGQAAVISDGIASVRRALERIDDGTYGEREYRDRDGEEGSVRRFCQRQAADEQ